MLSLHIVMQQTWVLQNQTLKNKFNNHKPLPITSGDLTKIQ